MDNEQIITLRCSGKINDSDIFLEVISGSTILVHRLSKNKAKKLLNDLDKAIHYVPCPECDY